MILQTELKICYRLADNKNIDAWLEQLDLKSMTRIHDEYFDTSDHTYYQKGILIRLRSDNVLEIKSDSTHLTKLQAINSIECREYRFPVRKHMFDPKQLLEFNELEAAIGIKRPLPFSFSCFLGCNKLRTLVTLNKTQKTYKCTTFPRILIVVEVIDQLGTFVKFEGYNITLPYSIDDFLSDIQQLVKNLPLLPCDSDYVILALRETNESLHNNFREQKS